jgi:hypothetical protein
MAIPLICTVSIIGAFEHDNYICAVWPENAAGMNRTKDRRSYRTKQRIAVAREVFFVEIGASPVMVDPAWEEWLAMLP